MSKLVHVFLLLCVASLVSVAQHAVQPAIPTGVKSICFVRGDFIYGVDEKNPAPRRIVRGADPSLSPSGHYLVYTINTKGVNDPDRTLKVMDLATGKVSGFDTLKGYNSWGGIWSPDESKIAFSILTGNMWHVALLEPQTGRWNVITKSIGGESGLFLSSWTPEGHSVLCTDLQSVFEVGVDGKLIGKISIAKMAGDEANITSDSRFSFSSDRRYLLFNTADAPDLGAVYVYDFRTKALRRVTSKRIEASQPQWLPSGDEVLYVGYRKYPKVNETPDVYRISVSGPGEAIVLRNGAYVSIATR
jgi:Tol biopolymer transport system component